MLSPKRDNMYLVLNKGGAYELTMHVARWRPLGRVYVRVGVHPQYASVRPRSQDAGQSPHCNRVVPAQCQDKLPFSRLGKDGV